MKRLLRQIKTAYYSWLIRAGERRIQELQTQATGLFLEREQAINDVMRLRISRIQANLDE